jgi:hypothetical protein
MDKVLSAKTFLVTLGGGRVCRSGRFFESFLMPIYHCSDKFSCVLLDSTLSASTGKNCTRLRQVW